ncbi:MAG: MurT ligase domain-containing protein [Syntrophomonadaceae bacterium]
MNRIRLLLAILVGKTFIIISRLLGNQGSSFPGKMARRIYPGILRELAAKVNGKIIIVTGTNGKTTTSNMLGRIISEPGTVLVHNQSGANMLPGITTAFIEKTSLTGRKHFDYALLETDEAYVPLLIEEVNAGLLLITNFFSDQLDRFGELDNIVKMIKDTVKDREIDLLLNADDPLTAHFRDLTSAHSFYFGFTATGYDSYDSRESREGRHCVICGQELEYQRYHYAGLGKFTCPGCGNHNPEPDFTGHNLVMNPTIELMVDDLEINSPYQGFYNAYNVVAAVAAARIIGINQQQIQTAIAGYQPQAGRMETFHINGRPAVLILVKNPTGLNQSLTTVIQDHSSKNLFFALNDNAGDGRDISWIWDADIEVIEEEQDRIKQIVCSGLRSGDMALRVKYAGYPVERLEIKTNLKEAIKYITGLEGETIYLLSTYSALFECRKILLELQKQADKIPAPVPDRMV